MGKIQNSLTGISNTVATVAGVGTKLGEMTAEQKAQTLAATKQAEETTKQTGIQELMAQKDALERSEKNPQTIYELSSNRGLVSVADRYSELKQQQVRINKLINADKIDTANLVESQNKFDVLSTRIKSLISNKDVHEEADLWNKRGK